MKKFWRFHRCILSFHSWRVWFQKLTLRICPNVFGNFSNCHFIFIFENIYTLDGFMLVNKCFSVHLFANQQMIRKFSAECSKKATMSCVYHNESTLSHTRWAWCSQSLDEKTYGWLNWNDYWVKYSICTKMNCLAQTNSAGALKWMKLNVNFCIDIG